MKIKGYAAIFGTPDKGGDIVQAGAFSATLAERRSIPLLWQHRFGDPVGECDLLREDDHGMWVEATVSHPSGLDQIRRGVTGLSFGYRVRAADRYQQYRHLKELELVEVSLVVQPMHPDARLT